MEVRSAGVRIAALEDLVNSNCCQGQGNRCHGAEKPRFGVALAELLPWRRGLSGCPASLKICSHVPACQFAQFDFSIMPKLLTSNMVNSSAIGD